MRPTDPSCNAKNIRCHGGKRDKNASIQVDIICDWDASQLRVSNTHEAGNMPVRFKPSAPCVKSASLNVQRSLEREKYRFQWDKHDFRVLANKARAIKAGTETCMRSRFGLGLPLPFCFPFTVLPFAHKFIDILIVQKIIVIIVGLIHGKVRVSISTKRRVGIVKANLAGASAVTRPRERWFCRRNNTQVVFQWNGKPCDVLLSSIGGHLTIKSDIWNPG